MKIKNYQEWLLPQLEDKEFAVGYLQEVLMNESQEAFLIALRDVVEARGENISNFSEKAGITRTTFYHALSKDGNPCFATIRKILSTLGLGLSLIDLEAA